MLFIGKANSIHHFPGAGKLGSCIVEVRLIFPLRLVDIHRELLLATVFGIAGCEHQHNFAEVDEKDKSADSNESHALRCQRSGGQAQHRPTSRRSHFRDLDCAWHRMNSSNTSNKNSGGNRLVYLGTLTCVS